jgi:hypothetical protein
MACQTGFNVVSSGTLEKDVKYAAKVPVIIFWIGQIINKVVRSPHLWRFNEILFQRLSLLIYYFCKITGLRYLFLTFIKEGVRSYIILSKP